MLPLDKFSNDSCNDFILDESAVPKSPSPSHEPTDTHIDTNQHDQICTQNIQQTCTPNVLQACTQNVQQTSTQNVQQACTQNVQQTCTQIVQQACTQNVQQTSTQNVQHIQDDQDYTETSESNITKQYYRNGLIASVNKIVLHNTDLPKNPTSNAGSRYSVLHPTKLDLKMSESKLYVKSEKQKSNASKTDNSILRYLPISKPTTLKEKPFSHKVKTYGSYKVRQPAQHRHSISVDVHLPSEKAGKHSAFTRIKNNRTNVTQYLMRPRGRSSFEPFLRRKPSIRFSNSSDIQIIPRRRLVTTQHLGDELQHQFPQRTVKRSYANFLAQLDQKSCQIDGKTLPNQMVLPAHQVTESLSADVPAGVDISRGDSRMDVFIRGSSAPVNMKSSPRSYSDNKVNVSWPAAESKQARIMKQVQRNLASDHCQTQIQKSLKNSENCPSTIASKQMCANKMLKDHPLPRAWDHNHNDMLDDVYVEFVSRSANRSNRGLISGFRAEKNADCDPISAVMISQCPTTPESKAEHRFLDYVPHSRLPSRPSSKLKSHSVKSADKMQVKEAAMLASTIDDNSDQWKNNEEQDENPTENDQKALYDMKTTNASPDIESSQTCNDKNLPVFIISDHSDINFDDHSVFVDDSSNGKDPIVHSTRSLHSRLEYANLNATLVKSDTLARISNVDSDRELKEIPPTNASFDKSRIDRPCIHETLTVESISAMGTLSLRDPKVVLNESYLSGGGGGGDVVCDDGTIYDESENNQHNNDEMDQHDDELTELTSDNLNLGEHSGGDGGNSKTDVKDDDKNDDKDADDNDDDIKDDDDDEEEEEEEESQISDAKSDESDDGNENNETQINNDDSDDDDDEKDDKIDEDNDINSVSSSSSSSDEVGLKSENNDDTDTETSSQLSTISLHRKENSKFKKDKIQVIVSDHSDGSVAENSESSTDESDSNSDTSGQSTNHCDKCSAKAKKSVPCIMNKRSNVKRRNLLTVPNALSPAKDKKGKIMMKMSRASCIRQDSGIKH